MLVKELGLQVQATTGLLQERGDAYRHAESLRLHDETSRRSEIERRVDLVAAMAGAAQWGATQEMSEAAA